MVSSRQFLRHALLDASTLDTEDAVTYPAGAATEGILSLADGRWLTSEYATGRVQLWGR